MESTDAFPLRLSKKSLATLLAVAAAAGTTGRGGVELFSLLGSPSDKKEYDEYLSKVFSWVQIAIDCFTNHSGRCDCPAQTLRLVEEVGGVSDSRTTAIANLRQLREELVRNAINPWMQPVRRTA